MPSIRRSATAASRLSLSDEHIGDRLTRPVGATYHDVMSAVSSRRRIIAVRHGRFRTTKGRFYLNYDEYDRPDEPLDVSYWFWVIEGEGSWEKRVWSVRYLPARLTACIARRTSANSGLPGPASSCINAPS